MFNSIKQIITFLQADVEFDEGQNRMGGGNLIARFSNGATVSIAKGKSSYSDEEDNTVEVLARTTKKVNFYPTNGNYSDFGVQPYVSETELMEIIVELLTNEEMLPIRRCTGCESTSHNLRRFTAFRRTESHLYCRFCVKEEREDGERRRKAVMQPVSTYIEMVC